MQTLLNDIELDIQELKFLVQAVSSNANPALRVVAKRNIQQMRSRLDALLKQLDEVSELPPVALDNKPEAHVFASSKPALNVSSELPVNISSEQIATTLSVPILAECIKPATDLRHAISLNDSFRFARELFKGDTARMNDVLRQLSASSSLDKALELFVSMVSFDEENEAAIDFTELLKKYFS